MTLSRQFFSSLSDHTALLIGAGETIELVARHLRESGIGQMVIANRTFERAHTLASEVAGYAIALSELPEHLAEADLVIASTASQTPIVSQTMVATALKQRKHRPVLMVDIAVPRDIEPEVGRLDDIYLYTVDDLREIIDEGLRSRQEAAQQAEEIIETRAGHFLAWMRSLEAVETIRHYRLQSEALRDRSVAQALRRLERGGAASEVVVELARQLTNRLIHRPCEQMRQAGYDGHTELLQAAQTLLLDLDEG